MTKDGRVEPLLRVENVGAFIQWARLSIFYNTFTRRYVVDGLPGFTVLDDTALRQILTVAHNFDLRASAALTRQVAFYMGDQCHVHPVRTYLAGLSWDGRPRLDTWLVKYAKAVDTPLPRVVGRKWLIAAVRRVREPGVKFDHMLVLVGEQGQGKSSVGRVLATDPWFCDTLGAATSSKEVLELTDGKWIAEVAELGGLDQRKHDRVKASITRQFDEARRAYKADTSREGRQFVLYGTTNQHRFLTDPTGNRRFWPVECTGGPGSIDLEGLAKIRDQLWAEAAHFEARGEPLVLPPELMADAAAEQEKHRVIEPDEERLSDLLAGIEFGFVPTDELLKALNLSKRHQHHVAEIMMRLGWLSLANALEIRLPGGRRWRKRGWYKGDNYRACILLFGSSGELAPYSEDEIKQRNSL